MTKIMALLAFILVAGFIGILVWKVREFDLLLVAVLTVGLVAYDFITSTRNKRD